MKNKFELSAKFCLFNNAVVLESSEKSVLFGIKNVDDVELKQKLEKTAKSFFKENGFENGKVAFKKIDDEEIKKFAVFNEFGNQNQKQKIQKEETDESVTSMMLTSLLEEAVKQNATDIHIEEKKVRFRIFGRLSDYCELSPQKSRELSRRIKALSNLDLLSTRKGQDGKFIFEYESRKVFARVSCVPAVSENNEECESLVIRLLDTKRVPLELDLLGFDEEQISNLKGIIANDNGLVLICGATGSGKSTTASALLKILSADRTKKIVTIEDPPEYVLNGTTQIRIDEKNGLGFDEALRLVFRQDPDVIFVGEIRDEISAKICMRASLTGHLVISTLHSSGIKECFSRLRDLGVNECDFYSAIKGIVHQKISVVKSVFKDELCFNAQICDEFPFEWRKK